MYKLLTILQEIRVLPKLTKLEKGKKYKIYYDKVLFGPDNSWHEFIVLKEPGQLRSDHVYELKFTDNNEIVVFNKDEIDNLIKKGEIKHG